VASKEIEKILEWVLPCEKTEEETLCDECPWVQPSFGCALAFAKSTARRMKEKMKNGS